MSGSSVVQAEVSVSSCLVTSEFGSTDLLDLASEGVKI